MSNRGAITVNEVLPLRSSPLIIHGVDVLCEFIVLKTNNGKPLNLQFSDLWGNVFFNATITKSENLTNEIPSNIIEDDLYILFEGDNTGTTIDISYTELLNPSNGLKKAMKITTATKSKKTISSS